MMMLHHRLLVLTVGILSTIFHNVVDAEEDKPAAGALPCKFCSRGDITEPEKLISIPGFEFLNHCEAVDALIPAVLLENDKECQLIQSLSTYCGCPKPEDACSLCTTDGSSVPDPEKEVPWLAATFGGIVPTCSIVEAYAASLGASDEACSELLPIGSHCGCPALEDHCVYCPGETLREEYMSVELPFLDDPGLNITGTCELYYLSQYQIPQDDDRCDLSIYVTFHCGCNDGVLGYLGTSTANQQAFIAWLPRAVALLSLAGSLIVLWDIMRNKKKRASVYHQLITLIAIFDIITSLVWMIGTFAVTEYSNLTGLEWGIYGANGNEASCQAQSFFFQLGFTSVFLNVALTVYYLMVIVYGVREQRLKKARKYLFGTPLVVGFGLAFAVIPFTNVGWLVCQFNSYPLNDNLWKILVFGFIPILGSTVVILILLVMIYCKVRGQSQRARRWRFKKFGKSMSAIRLHVQGSRAPPTPYSAPRRKVSARPHTQSTTDRLEQEVFYQCLAYAASFGLSWPILALAEVKGNDFSFPFCFWILVATVAPLQGALNAMCYFRPFRRFTKHNRQMSRRRARNSVVEADATAERASTAMFLKKHIRRYSEAWSRSSFAAPTRESELVAQQLDPTMQLANMCPVIHEDASAIHQ